MVSGKKSIQIDEELHARAVKLAASETLQTGKRRTNISILEEALNIGFTQLEKQQKTKG